MQTRSVACTMAEYRTHSQHIQEKQKSERRAPAKRKAAAKTNGHDKYEYAADAMRMMLTASCQKTAEEGEAA